MAHGGKRPGAGRKPNPLKELRIGAATAEKILRELGHEKEIIKLYRECGDARLKVHIIFRLREWAYGKASQPLEHAGGDKPVDISHDVGNDPSKRLAELLGIATGPTLLGELKLGEQAEAAHQIDDDDSTAAERS